MPVHAMAASAPKSALKPFTFEPGPLGEEEVEIRVESCGICHSDLSMIDNEWGISAYPLVPGHEVVGSIVAAGKGVKGRRVGERVGLGWYSASCLSCRACLGGDHNLCTGNQQTIVARHGGFATRVRCQWAWATPLPAAIDAGKAGPLFCGGITVFNPIVQLGVQPTQRVGVVGIGGLGHLAVQFLNKWGCEVVAFTSSEAKAAEARSLGAHRTVNSTSDADLAKIKGGLDFLLVTVNVPLNWGAYMEALAPRGRMHFVGAVLAPVPVSAWSLIAGQRSISGTPLGSPAITLDMINFAARHKVAPITEEFALSDVNAALVRLRSGKARYRIVLKNDLD